MAIDHNERIFGPIADEFVVRYVKTIALNLHRNDLVPFDVHVYDTAMSDLLFELCFLGIAQFEEQSGFEGDGKTYTPRAAFETDRNAPSPTLLLGDTLLHGLVEDDVLNEGIARARASLGKQGGGAASRMSTSSLEDSSIPKRKPR